MARQPSSSARSNAPDTDTSGNASETATGTPSGTATETTSETASDGRAARPRVLELGGGREPATDGLNVDLAPVAGVDVLADVTAPWPFESATFDRIEAHHVLEHLPHDDLPTVFREVARTLRPGGTFHAVVPLAHGRSAVTDPTHRSTWYWRTPAYYTAADDLSYEVDAGADLALVDRGLRLFLTSGKWYARPPSWLLKQAARRSPALIELVKLPYVTGYLAFTMERRR